MLARVVEDQLADLAHRAEADRLEARAHHLGKEHRHQRVGHRDVLHGTAEEEQRELRERRAREAHADAVRHERAERLLLDAVEERAHRREQLNADLARPVRLEGVARVAARVVGRVAEPRRRLLERVELRLRVAALLRPT